MSDHPNQPPVSKVSDFIDEYWVLFFFGSFFLMTMSLPVLMLNWHSFLYWVVAAVLVIIFGLISAAIFFHQIQHH